MIIYVWVFLAALVGGFLQSIIGFGVGVICMALFSLFFTYMPYAAAVSMFITLFGSMWILRGRWRKADLKKMLPVMIVYFAIMPVATALSTRLPKNVFGFVLAGVLIVLSSLNIFFEGKVRIKANVGSAIVIGVLAGILGGLFNMSGSAVVFYALAAFDDKENYIASISAYYVVTNIYGMVVRYFNGLLTQQVLLWSAAGVAGVFVGVVLGCIVYKKISFPTLRKWIYGFIGVSGIWMVISNL